MSSRVKMGRDSGELLRRMVAGYSRPPRVPSPLVSWRRCLWSCLSRTSAHGGFLSAPLWEPVSLRLNLFRAIGLDAGVVLVKLPRTIKPSTEVWCTLRRFMPRSWKNHRPVASIPRAIHMGDRYRGVRLKGYQVWADALKPLLRELLGPPAKVDHAPPPTGDPSATKKRASSKSPAMPDGVNKDDAARKPGSHRPTLLGGQGGGGHARSA